MALAQAAAFALAMLYSVFLSAATSPGDILAASSELERIEKSLQQTELASEDLGNWIRRSQEIKQAAGLCIGEAEFRLGKIARDLELLGPPLTTEAAEVSRQRQVVESDKQATDGRLVSCRLMSLRSDEILARLVRVQQQQTAKRLLARTQTITQLLKDNWDERAVWLEATRSFIEDHSGIDRLSPSYWALLTTLVAGALASGAFLRKGARSAPGFERSRSTFSGQFSQALIVVFGQYLPHLFATGMAAVFFYFLTREAVPVPFVTIVAFGLPGYFLLFALIHLFLDPFPPAQALHRIPAPVARALARRLKLLVLLIFAGYLTFTTLLAHSLPEPALLLVRGLFAGIFILNLVWITWLLGYVPRLAQTRGLRTFLTVFLLAILVLEWMGYRNLSAATLKAATGTLAAFGVAWLLARLLREFFDSFNFGRHRLLRAVRAFLGVPPGHTVPGLQWVRIALLFALWSGFAIAVLRIWGLSDTAFRQVIGVFSDGFRIGSLNIVPAKILLALLAFALLLTVSAWFRSRLEKDWLPRTGMERGAREAMATMSGYLGIAVAILVALAMAGMEFGNLAIIAGALSVGIGFGLQNIVNNFVSGLILLFERPVKTGDWVVVGETEGYVKKISIRSTQIQTFDRADVIVPNSELISNQVTNWMLHDPRGRVRVAVGVAYGSDTALVKDLLLEAAQAHPLVIKDEDIAPEPKVLFRSFGDSSLDFELRCFIENIDQRLTVVSDLNFAIDAAFRAHGVEIPFPQRDLHLRTWPGGIGYKGSAVADDEAI